MKNKKDKIIFLSILIIVSICVGIGYSTAYFRANISYDENKSEENKVIMANVGVTFEDGDTLSLDNALPGDSVSKTFTVTNSSDSTALYSIDFFSITNTFVNNDVVYSLYEVVDNEDTDLVSETTLPSTTTNTTNIVDCISIDKNTSKTYKLVLLFKETDIDQSVNMNKEVSVTLSLTGLDGIKCPTPIEKNVKLLSISSDTIIDETDDKNIRYVGENPNNYIWFNCFDYSDISTCERWRIIGVMNNVSTVSNGTQSLLKIIRADNITDMSGNNDIPWDYTTTGESYADWNNTNLKDYRSKTRTEDGATLRRILNDAYYGNETVKAGYWSSSSSTVAGTRTYTYTKDSKDTTVPRGITNVSKSIIEQVNWNVGLSAYSSTPLYMYKTVKTTWAGYIGLMDPSDFGYATDGGTVGRSECLNVYFYYWKEGDYLDCVNNSWLLYINPTSSNSMGKAISQWTIRPMQNDAVRPAVWYASKSYGIDYTGAPSLLRVRPALYLTSYISIYADIEHDGSYEHPYNLSNQ